MGTDVINIPKRSVYMEISEDEMSRVISKFNDFAKKNLKLVRSDIRGSLQPEKEFSIVLTDWFKIVVSIVDGRYCVTEYNDNGKAYTVKYPEMVICLPLQRVYPYSGRKRKGM